MTSNWRTIVVEFFVSIIKKKLVSKWTEKPKNRGVAAFKPVSPG